ncbi:flavin reductase family protein [Gordonia terrae]
MSFREVMAHVATPVAIVTSTDDTQPVGTTVSAFMSLSMTPPMVVVALDKTSETLRVIETSRTFGLSVLSSAQHAIALTLATKGGAGKFDGVSWTSCDGNPRIDGAAGWIACAADTLVDGGDHVMVLGNVIAAEHETADPLTYHGRAFGTHSAVSPV